MKKFLSLTTIIFCVLFFFGAPMAIAGSDNKYNIMNDSGYAIEKKEKKDWEKKEKKKAKQGQAQGQLQGQAQGQIQGQAQGQLQGQAQGQTAHNEGVEQNITIVEAETKRDHMNAGEVKFGNLSSYSGEYINGANFCPIRKLTLFKKEFSFAAAVKDYGKKFGQGKCKTIGHSYNGRFEEDASEKLRVYTMDELKAIPDGTISIGFLTVKAIKKDIDSFMVLQKAILSGGIMKGDAILVTGEGAEKVMKTSGWGLGFNTSGGIINDKGNRGNSAAASGGTGYSSGKAGLDTRPWMTIQVLKYNR